MRQAESEECFDVLAVLVKRRVQHVIQELAGGFVVVHARWIHDATLDKVRDRELRVVRSPMDSRRAIGMHRRNITRKVKTDQFGSVFAMANSVMVREPSNAFGGLYEHVAVV